MRNRVRTSFILALISLLLFGYSAQADTPSLNNFPEISIAYGSINSLLITPPSSNSSGTWMYQSSNPKVALIQGNSIIPISIGSATLTALQSASGNYSIGSISTTINITPGIPLLGPFPDDFVAFKGKGTTYTIKPPNSNSNGIWSFASLNPNVATIKGTTVTVLGLGIAPISAVQSETSNFTASSPIVMQLRSVGPAPLIEPWLPVSTSYTDSSFKITPPKSQSTGKWSYKLPKVQGIIELSDDTVKIIGVGATTIIGYQEPDAIWGPTQATLKITINKSNPTTGTLMPFSIRAKDPAQEIPLPTSNSEATWNFKSSDNSIARIKGSKIEGIKPGTITLTAVQNAGNYFTASSEILTTVTITNPAIPPMVGEFTPMVLFLNAPAFLITPPKSSSNGLWSFESENSQIVQVNSNLLKGVSLGQTTISAIQSENGNFASVSKKFEITVIPKFKYSVVIKNRNIQVQSTNKLVKVFIDGKSGVIGNNYARAGNHEITIFFNNGLLWRESVRVK